MRNWAQVAIPLVLLVGAQFIQSLAARTGVTLADGELAFAFLYVGAALMLYRSSARHELALEKVSFKGGILAALAGLLLFAVGLIAYAGTTVIYSQIGWPLPDQLSFFDIQDIYGRAALITFVMASALLEEFVFRGMILGTLRKHMSAFAAILVSSVCFSLYHLSLFQIPATFIWGLGLGILMIRTNSLFAPIIAHMTFNLVSVGLFMSGALSAA